jgi:hypothetical protein
MVIVSAMGLDDFLRFPLFLGADGFGIPTSGGHWLGHN